MKFVVTGSLGNISKPLTQLLVGKGHEVTVVSSDAQKTGQIEALGARAAIGSVEDTDFLTKTFKGADGVYTMVPPNWGASHYRGYIGGVGHHYLKAIKASEVKKVINLSSIGADLEGGTGSIAGLHDVENLLNSLDGVSVRHLRAGLFMTNFFFDIGAIRAMGIMGNNYGAETRQVMTHPRDIAEAAFTSLDGSLTGKDHVYIASEEGQVGDFVKVLGAAIGKPELPWVKLSDEDALKGMAGAGMSRAIAEMYVEMGRAIGSGALFKDFEKHKPGVWGATKLADFAIEFAAAYQSQK